MITLLLVLQHYTKNSSVNCIVTIKATMMIFNKCELNVKQIVPLTFNFQFVIITPKIILQVKVHNSNFNIFSNVNINPPITVPKSWVITRPLWRANNSGCRRESLGGILRVRRTLRCLFKKKYKFSKFGKRYKATPHYSCLWEELLVIKQFHNITKTVLNKIHVAAL